MPARCRHSRPWQPYPDADRLNTPPPVNRRPTPARPAGAPPPGRPRTTPREGAAADGRAVSMLRAMMDTCRAVDQCRIDAMCYIDAAGRIGMTVRRSVTRIPEGTGRARQRCQRGPAADAARPLAKRVSKRVRRWRSVRVDSFHRYAPTTGPAAGGGARYQQPGRRARRQHHRRCQRRCQRRCRRRRTCPAMVGPDPGSAARRAGRGTVDGLHRPASPL